VLILTFSVASGILVRENKKADDLYLKTELLG
jgi:hypothetical protein